MQTQVASALRICPPAGNFRLGDVHALSRPGCRDPTAPRSPSSEHSRVWKSQSQLHSTVTPEVVRNEACGVCLHRTLSRAEGPGEDRESVSAASHAVSRFSTGRGAVTLLCMAVLATTLTHEMETRHTHTSPRGRGSRREGRLVVCGRPARAALCIAPIRGRGKHPVPCARRWIHHWSHG